LITLHLVRHGESEWHAENRYAGHTDIALTKLGHAQAIDLKEWAVALKPISIYSSDLSRAIDTARPSAESLGLKIQIEERLREVNFGKIEGLTPAEMESQYPELRKNFVKSPAGTLMPGGESGELALGRAMHVINEIVRRARDGDVLIVCHGTIMRLIACDLLGIEPDEYRRAFPAIPNIGRLTLQIIGNPTEKNAKLNAELIDPQFKS